MAGLGSIGRQHPDRSGAGSIVDCWRNGRQRAGFALGQPFSRLDHPAHAAGGGHFSGHHSRLYLWDVEIAQAYAGLDAPPAVTDRLYCLFGPPGSRCSHTAGDGGQRGESERTGTLAEDQRKIGPPAAGINGSTNRSYSHKGQGIMNWRKKTIAIGAVVGLLLGIAAAYIVIQRAERENAIPQISAGDGVKVGLGLLGVLRLIADLGEPG